LMMWMMSRMHLVVAVEVEVEVEAEVAVADFQLQEARRVTGGFPGGGEPLDIHQ
jgi:hypothetical protein